MTNLDKARFKSQYNSALRPARDTPFMREYAPVMDPTYLYDYFDFLRKEKFKYKKTFLK
jgi:hypothetical protein